MRTFEQEELMNRNAFCESIQEHFQFRVARDLTNTGATPWTLRPEEAEEALNLAGGPGRPAMATILTAMDKTAKYLQWEAKDNLMFFTEDETVHEFMDSLRKQIGLADHKNKMKGVQHGREQCETATA